jgi:hypothetical protein
MSPPAGNAADGPGVLVCTSGKGPKGTGSELEKTLRITPRKGRAGERKVVMRLPPGDQAFTCMPDLAPGDLLRVTAELEVTTDAKRKEDCVGEPYSFSPIARVSLLLANARDATKADPKRALLLGKPAEFRCSHAAHHRVIVLKKDWRVPDEGLPWRGSSSLNLVLEAHHEDAKPGHLLLVGENERPEGGGKMTVGGDKGRLNLIRFRGAGPRSGDRQETRHIRANGKSIPIDETRTVVYSQPLKGVVDGEQFAVEAKLRASHPSFPARLSARLFLADSPGQTEQVKYAKDAAALGGEISELNGFNCRSKSCVIRKHGVARVTDRPARDPMYVNLVAICGDPEKTGKRDPVRLSDGGFLRVTRYASAKRS